MDHNSTPVTTTLFISNLHCPSCVTSIEGNLATLTPQPISVSHSIISHSVTVRHHEDLGATDIVEALDQAGFEVYSVVQGGQKTGFSSLSEQQQQHLRGPSSTADWGLENAVQRWIHSWRDAGVNAEESKKRKRHMEQCQQCQRESHFSDLDEMKKGAQARSSGGSNDMSYDAAAPVVVVDTDEPRAYRITLSISGMTCGACTGTVSNAISQNSCVKDVNVNLLSNSATIIFQGKGNEDKIIESIDDAGYEATLDHLGEICDTTEETTTDLDDLWTGRYSIGGMTCSACVGAITNGLKDKSWIKHIDVNLISNSASITFQGERRAEEITEMIEDLGYDASLEEVSSLHRETAASSERTVSIKIDGMYCHHCPARILRALSDAFDDKVKVHQSLSEREPLLRISYQPHVPDFTLRHIVNTIRSVDTSLTASIYHPPTVEERSQEIHAKERRRILLRLALSVIVAIPTFIIGIVFMDLVESSNPGRRFLMQPIWAGNVSRGEWSLFIMSTVIYFFAADMFHARTIGGIRAMWRKGSPVPVLERFYRFGSMNMLITIGTSIAYFSSIAALGINATAQKSLSSSSSTSYYFDSVVFLTMFLLAGRFLEAYSKSRTGDAVASLGALRPTTAFLIHEDTSPTSPSSPDNDHALPPAETTPVDLLEVGDCVRIPQGSTPPFDGTIHPLSSPTTFDESSLTGESRPVKKSPHDIVYAGTINKGHPVTITLTSISGTSMLDQIIKAVREGQTRRAPVERVADVVTAHFVPFVVVVGVVTWLLWLALGLGGALPSSYLDSSSSSWAFWALEFSIAVFVIACPCGIGLAGPTALFVGGGIAAKNGILVKGGGEAFQEASMLDCVVFDKTGTLTEGGRPKVTEVHIIDGGRGDDDETAMMSVARSLEENSGHPIAAAIVDFCTSRGGVTLTTTDAEEIAGRGLKGKICLTEDETITAILGNEALLADYKVELDTKTREVIESWKLRGLSIALLAKTTTTRSPSSSSSDFAAVAAFAISDAIRPEAAEVIQALQRRGLSVWMLSGDNQITASTVGEAVGIPAANVIAGVLPEQKADKIKYLQRTLPSRKKHGRGWFSQRTKNSRATVAMVGDGINDAPALATADVGIAIGSGSDVALSTASFVLVKSDLHSLVTLITLSRAVFRRVWFNFGWALIYNLVALPIAAGVLYPIKSGGSHVRLDPVWASLAMALSSVSVVTSSLLLRTKIPWIGFRSSKGA